MEYHRSVRWIRQQIDQYEPEEFTIPPSLVVLIADATYFGKRNEGFGTLVFWDHHHKRPIAFKHFEGTERKADYLYLRQEIEVRGFTIQAVVIDGRKGIRELFEDVPVQICHFHQQAILTRYLTRHPKSQAARDLKCIASYLGRVGSCRFSWLLKAWKKRHLAYFNEKTIHPETGRSRFTHKRLRRAYHSLERNLPWLFTYRKHPKLKIPNTTNPLDGGLFSPLKKKINFHTGIRKSLKVKMIDIYLTNLAKQHSPASKKFH